MRDAYLGLNTLFGIIFISTFNNINVLHLLKIPTYTNYRVKIKECYYMWHSVYMQDTIKEFLPPRAEIIMLENPYKVPAVITVDLDGDGVLELIGAYYWQGDNYIIVLKYYNNSWHVADTIKGKGYNITYLGTAPITDRKMNSLIVGWHVGVIGSDLSVYEWTGTEISALKSIDRALAFEYPYLSKDELLHLKNQLLQFSLYGEKFGIDFSSVEFITSEVERDVKLEQAIEEEFHLKEMGGNVKYYYNKVDLNEDGNPEVFVYLVGPYVCGTGGCSGAIFEQKNGEYKLLSRFSLVRNPVIISDTKTNGYRDIIMYVAGGGIESFYAWVKYDGTTYPVNPSTQPRVEPGTKVDGIAIFADDITTNPGIDL